MESFDERSDPWISQSTNIRVFFHPPIEVGGLEHSVSVVVGDQSINLDHSEEEPRKRTERPVIPHTVRS